MNSKIIYTASFILAIAGLCSSSATCQVEDISSVELPSFIHQDYKFQNRVGGIERNEGDWLFSDPTFSPNPPNNPESGYTLFLDSVYEENNIGLVTNYKRWYYIYNQLYQLDSAYYYIDDEHGDFANITEICTYNADGQVKRFVRLEPFPDFWFLDTGLSEHRINEYYYEDGNLVREININQSGYSLRISDTDTIAHRRIDTNSTYYVYNNKGRLVYDSLVYNSDNYRVSNYLYNNDLQLEYLLLLRFNNNQFSWEIEKYSYEQSDTSLVTLIQYAGIYNYQELTWPVFDTITSFSRTRSYFETFDEQGKRASMKVDSWTDRWGAEEEYSAEYKYTPLGSLQHISYYHNWKGTPDEGRWVDTLYVDYTYDEEGNIDLYEEKFWDARVGYWELANRKEYYYTPVSNALEIQENSFTALELYPNPARSIITLKGTYNPSAMYTIADHTGRIIARDKLVEQSIDISSYESGLFVIIIETDSGLYSGKFVKY